MSFSLNIQKFEDSNAQEIKSKACGKVIFTGEYSVLYKNPAIIVPLKKYTTCLIKLNNNNKIITNLYDYNLKNIISLKDLHNIFENKKLYDKNCNLFPAEFISLFHILFEFHEKFKQKIENLRIDIFSEIPIFSGYGSSAAFIVSIVKSLIKFYKLQVKEKDILEICKNTEDLIHGSSSGADTTISYLEKSLFFYSLYKYEEVNYCLENFYLIDTGKPECTTKECIEKVKSLNYKSSFWNHFEKIALNLHFALQKQESNLIIDLLKKNHKLLQEIKIVPNKIKEFIFEIEKFGGAAKISGAGAIKGEKGGNIIVYTENENLLRYVCKNFNYTFEKINN